MKHMKTIAILSALLLLAAALAGCGGRAEETPSSLSIVIGNHACSRELNLSAPIIKTAVSDAVERGGFVSVVQVDGAPELVSADLYAIDERYQHADPDKLKTDAAIKAANLLSSISTVQANDPEVDTLEALRIALRSFAYAPEEGERRILVIDSGLSTAGYLSFQNGLLSASPEAMVQELKERGALPDFTGVEVLWQQLGDVAEPQQALSPRQTQRLTDIWQAIVTAGGGSFTLCGGMPNAGALGAGLPAVSPVPLAADAPIAFTAENADFSAPQMLTEEQVRFLGDSAEFADPDAARGVIRPIAEYLKAHPAFRLLLIGTTAGDGDTEYARALSEQRAEAVRQALIALGANPEQITARGLGSQDPWHIPGAGTDGPLAAQNRKVVLLDAQYADTYLPR